VHPNFTQRRFFLSFFVASGYGSRNSNRDTTEARRLYLITASVSMLGYHHDLKMSRSSACGTMRRIESAKRNTRNERSHERFAEYSGESVVSGTGRVVTLSPRDYDTVFFDLVGVLTRTASVHAAAWGPSRAVVLSRRYPAM